MKKSVLLLCYLALAACSPNVETRGHIKDAEWKEQIKVGETNRDGVMLLLGSPSTVASFGPETWYYVNMKRESVAFFKPEVTEENVVKIEFDAAGVVSKVEENDKTAARDDFDYVARETPTEGHSMTVMEQALGNLGRFNSPGTQAGGRPRGPTR